MPKSPSHTVQNEPNEAPPMSYEEALRELEALVSQMESGQMPLNELMVAYQRGAALLSLCQDQLQAVEAQVRLLDDGVLKPWEPQA
jgi:exodeoxyribonuclease VII small subunit